MASELPEPISDDQFDAFLDDSPFLRTLDPAETYRLRGLATIEGKMVATVFNQKTEKTAVITGEEKRNEWGLRLVEVTSSDDLTGVLVTLELGGEEFELAYEPERITPGPQGGGAMKQYKVHYDSKGRAMPPKELMQKYHSMSESQRKKYWEWRNRYYEKNPKLKDSEKRFPVVDKAIDAIKAGKEPPKP